MSPEAINVLLVGGIVILFSLALFGFVLLKNKHT